MAGSHTFICAAAFGVALAGCSPPSAPPPAQQSIIVAQPAMAPMPSEPVVLDPSAPVNPAGPSLEQARPLSVGMGDRGQILAVGKSAFYRFDNKLSVRDLAIVRLDNQSTTLKPEIKIYDADKALIVSAQDATAGASVETSVPIEPGKAIYVEVAPGPSIGVFAISVTMQNAGDALEPNDDLAAASAASLNKEIVANIMDAKDHDVYRFTAAKKAALSVTLTNQSITLRPSVRIYDGEKAQKEEKAAEAAGGNLAVPISVAQGKDFYVEVLANDTAGAYKLTVK